FEEDAPAMVFWHARGWALYRVLEAAAREHVLAGGYREVRTPQLVRRPIWEKSGHWGKFHDAMFACGDDAALKPVSCPGHIHIVKKAAPSWRDLPIRIAEFGLVHRDEPSAALHGLLRLRQFCQDDGHIFCAEDQIFAEVERFCSELPAFYRKFGFEDVSVALSLRPDNRIGDDALWDRAEAALAAAADRLRLPVKLQPGAGAIYGPKLEFVLNDRRGRAWQCGTIQLDFVMPQRFDVRYVAPDGEKRHVVMLHRALFGSIERFLGMLLEHHGAALPAWLAPEQIAILPVVAAHVASANELAVELRERGLRVRVDCEESLKRRIAIAHHDGVPVQIVLGDREIADESVAIRARDAQWWSPRVLVAQDLVNRCRASPRPSNP
ncbi:MAG TPA: threonine--tRNA ligase, partial [Kofleriaceae bacterium]